MRNSRSAHGLVAFPSEDRASPEQDRLISLSPTNASKEGPELADFSKRRAWSSRRLSARIRLSTPSLAYCTADFSPRRTAPASVEKPSLSFEHSCHAGRQKMMEVSPRDADRLQLVSAPTPNEVKVGTFGATTGTWPGLRPEARNPGQLGGSSSPGPSSPINA
jgi:hypothetical protein